MGKPAMPAKTMRAQIDRRVYELYGLSDDEGGSDVGRTSSFALGVRAGCERYLRIAGSALVHLRRDGLGHVRRLPSCGMRTTEGRPASHSAGARHASPLPIHEMRDSRYVPLTPMAP